MSRRSSTALGTLAWVSWVALAASAHAEVRSGDVVTVADGEVVRGNLYASANTVLVHGDVLGDVVAVGGTLVVDGHVAGDLLALGGDVTVTGAVAGDARVAGAEVHANGGVGGDLMAAGSDVVLGGTVGGDLLLAAGTAHVGSVVLGELQAGLGDLALDGSVGHGVTVQGGSVRLGPHADVHGDVNYTGASTVARDRGARVSGAVVERERVAPEVARWAGWYGWLQGLLGSFFLGLLWLGFFQSFATHAVDALAAHPARSIGVGTLTFLAVPLVFLAVLGVGALVGGWWLALLGLAVYGIGIALTFPLVAAWLGRVGAARLHRSDVSPQLAMAVALLAMFLVLRVPVVGALLGLCVVLCGLGALASTLAARFDPPSTPQGVPMAFET